MKAIVLPVVISLLAACVPALALEVHDAAAAGDVAAVESMISADAELLTARNERNETILHVAATGGHLDVVRFLLERGLPVDIGDNEGSTALDAAAIQGHLELVAYLLEEGSDPTHADDFGMTPLHFACYNGHADIARLLIDHGADVHAARSTGGMPIHGAAYDGHIECINLLMEHGADINARTVGGYTPIISAAAGTAGLEAIELLVQHGADIHDRQFNGDSALMYAARAGKADVAEYLIGAGAGVASRNDFGWQAIHNAADSGNAEMLTLLLENGAEVDAKEGNGLTPLWWAAVRGMAEGGAVLLAHGADPNIAPVNGGACALMRAVDGGSLDFARLLLENGADSNVTDLNSGQTCLHHTALRGWSDLTELLLENGADFDIEDSLGMTPLRYAGRYGHRDVVDLLKANGATAPDMEENYGRSPLLDREIADGEASMWYLGHCGWAIKTGDHFLIFDYWSGQGQGPATPCLLNGHIDPAEISSENVYVFVTHEHGDHYDPVINSWEGEIEDLTYVFGFTPELTPAYRQAGYDGPAYTGMSPREHLAIGDMNVRTISANDGGVAFLVEVDGLTLYHAGDHAGWADGERDGFFEEIDYLAPYVDDLDMAFLNVTGCHAHDPERLREGNIYTLDTLGPKLLIPTHASGREYVYRDVAQEMAAEGVTTPVCLPDFRGDGFFYAGGRIE
jgi:ankyrin repeat protein/L-ascorbate metabolism protein UlaG (beta-lactamase superfamily)